MRIGRETALRLAISIDRSSAFYVQYTSVYSLYMLDIDICIYNIYIISREKTGCHLEENLAKIEKGCLKNHWARKTYNFCTCTS